MDRLDGKVCVITGGAGGIGLAMAARFRRAGMKIVIGDIEEAALEAAAVQLGDETALVRCDVTSPASMDDLRSAAIDRFGGAHVVCLNAGVAPVGMILQTDLETWRWAIDVNVLGVVHGIRSFGPLLVEQGEGHVVCTSSAAGLSSTMAMAAYSATKHAVVGIAATLREEMRPEGVGVSVLCPGALRSRIFESERNRPSELPGETYAAPEELVALFKGAVAAAPDPSVAADAVHDAVIDDRFFVIPSPEINVLIRDRIAEIEAALLP